jgi:UDPglucose 6-dehydrogenase
MMTRFSGRRQGMNISVIGCGYVGLTTGLALAELGNNIVLVDVVPEKLKTIEEMRSPFYEPGVDEMLVKHVSSGAIKTSTSVQEAVMSSDVTFITVGTPSREDGSMDDAFVRSASEAIAGALRDADDFKVIVMKSTVVPGTTDDLIRPILEEGTGKPTGSGFGLAMCPEFLREGAAMKDSLSPDRVVIGTHDDRTFEILTRLFEPLGSKVLRTSPKAAEMIKYASNSLLATKISFANEISRICEKVRVDVYEIMEGVGMDFRISPQFLRAGVGFGGSCFPKDVSALRHIAASMDLSTPLLDGVMENNDIQPGHLVDVAERSVSGLEGRKTLVLGLSFKPDTDDIRSTRSLPVVEELIGRGAIVGGHDPKAEENFKREGPQIEYFNTLNEALSWAEVVFLMTEWPEYRDIDWRSLDIVAVFDGRRAVDPSSMEGKKYWSMGTALPRW